MAAITQATTELTTKVDARLAAVDDATTDVVSKLAGAGARIQLTELAVERMELLAERMLKPLNDR